MELFEAIFSRRSIRQFEGKSVPAELLDKAIGAAMMAPSAGNAQPWQFVLIDDRALLDQVPDFHPYAAMSRQAAAAILVCGDLSLEKYPGNWPVDCAAATQNLLLALHALGLGAVWTGVYPDEARCTAFRSLLNLPQRVVPLAYIPIGYPVGVIPAPDRYKPDRIHRNRKFA